MVDKRASQENMEMRCQEIIKVMDEVLLSGWASVLFALRVGPDPRMIWISNIDREGVVLTLKVMMAGERTGTLSAEKKGLIREIGRAIDMMMLPGWKFALFTINDKQNPKTIYASNVNRQSVIAVVKQLIKKMETGEPEL